MMLQNLLAKTRSVHVQVNLRRGNRFVPEHFLYGSQIGASFEQMSGK